MTSGFVRRVSCCLLALALMLAGQTAVADADLLIKNARIIDGTGSPWFVSDLAITDGRISAMSKSLDIDADRVIDARGRVLAPGFIDVHTHVESSFSGGGLENLPRADNFLLDGVTTIITGNCGSSEVNVGRYRERLAKAGLGINVGTFIGHNSVRTAVMGLENRAPTPIELERMQGVVDQAMRDGAVGFSTGLLYVPGTYANTAEVTELAKAASVHGGVYTSHIREQGADLHKSINEAIDIGVAANMPIQLSHFKVKGRNLWGTIGDALELVDSHRRNGVDVVIDVYPYERASTNLGVNMPRWAVAGGSADIAERINDPDTNARMVAEMKEMLDVWGYDDYSFATVARYKPDESYNGRTVSEINNLLERSSSRDNEIRTIFDMMLDGGEAGDIQGASMVYHYMSVEDVDTIMRYPNAAVASDGGVRELGVGLPHPRSYGTNARVLADFVRERNVLTLEEAIRRMTSLPARTFSFHDRGMIRPGFVADLVLFDPETVTDRATFSNPHQYSEGFDYVVVNGVVAVAEGEITDARGGQFVARQ